MLLKAILNECQRNLEERINHKTELSVYIIIMKTGFDVNYKHRGSEGKLHLINVYKQTVEVVLTKKNPLQQYIKSYFTTKHKQRNKKRLITHSNILKYQTCRKISRPEGGTRLYPRCEQSRIRERPMNLRFNISNLNTSRQPMNECSVNVVQTASIPEYPSLLFHSSKINRISSQYKSYIHSEQMGTVIG